MRIIHLLVLLTIFSLCGCGPELPDPWEGDSVAPVDLTKVLGPEEARAGMLTTGGFIGGVAGESEPGDILLYNDRARFVIQGIREGNGYFRYAGQLIDADIVRPVGEPDHDGIDDLHFAPGLGRLFDASEVRVVSGGADGGPAVVEAIGTDKDFSFIVGAIEAPGFFEIYGLEIVQTYTLQPGVPVLEITTTVRNTTSWDLSLEMYDIGLFDLGTHAKFIAGAGFDGGAPDNQLAMLGLVERRNAQAVGIFLPEGLMEEAALSNLGDSIDLTMVQGPTRDIPAGGETDYTRFVGVARDLATLEEYRRGIQELPTGHVEGEVKTEGAGTPVMGARVFLTDADGNPTTMAISDENGAYRLAGDVGDAGVVAIADGNNQWVDVPAASGNYGVFAEPHLNVDALRAWSDPEHAAPAPLAEGYGRSEWRDVAITAGGDATRNLSLAKPGTLVLRVQDDKGQGIPAVVHVRFPAGVSDPAPADARWGENRGGSGARKTVWVVDGEARVPMPAGTWDLWAHQGFRHEIDSAEGVELDAGEIKMVTFELSQAYETPGWVSADLHVHASPSPDGKCTMEERIATMIAADVDVYTSTDHDCVADYSDVIEAMGADQWMTHYTGVEISPVMRGHYNAWPVLSDPSKPNLGAPIWWEHQLPTSELVDLFHDVVGDQALMQINHGYSGMFSFSDFDEETGEIGFPDYYSDNFDAMEILNGGHGGTAEKLKLAMCQHLDAGYRPIGTGTSDSHTRWSGPGRARTYVQLAGSLSEQTFFQSFASGRAVATTGPFVTVEAEGPGGEIAVLGDTLTADHATIRVQVWAPSWMQIDEVRLLTSGCEFVESYPVEGTDPLRADLEFEVEPNGDIYYLVEVIGSEDMWPVWPGNHAYALTNPIFITSM